MNNIVLCKEKLVGVNYTVVDMSPQLTFVLTEQKILVLTQFHTFFLRHTHRNYVKRLNGVRELILLREIHTATQLIDELKSQPGEGIEMIPTKLEWHL